MTYLFKTCATMKPYNNKNWWINSDIIGNLYIDAENVENALTQYQETVREKFYITISNNALKTKNPMYIDTPNGEPKQVGYVITALSDFQDDKRYKWVQQYIDLWVEISIIQDAF